MAIEFVNGVPRRVRRERPRAANGQGQGFAPPVVRSPAVRLDSGGIGDTLCALAAATGAGLPFVPPANRREWAELFADVPAIDHPTVELCLSDYRRELDQNVAPRWEFWAAQTGGHKLPALRPLPAEVLDAAIPYAGRIVLAPFAAHGASQGEWSRTWPADRWKEVNRLLIEAGFSTVILNDRDEPCWQFLSDEPVPHSIGTYRDRTALLCGQSPAMVAAVLRYATAFAGNDSGMAHLAGTLGVPGVAVCSACSDVRIFGCYPTMHQLGGRGRDFRAITPDVVAKAIRAQAVSPAAGFPVADFARVLLPQDRWRVTPFVGVYHALWRTVARLQPGWIVEIGCRAGYSSWTMLEACPKASVYAIDANLDEHGGFVGAEVHARRLLAGRNWCLRIADSHALTGVPAADLVYVDGDHTEAGCYQDLRLALTARPKWILVDDVANCAATVKPACDRFVRENGLTCEFIPSPTGLYLIHVG